MLRDEIHKISSSFSFRRFDYRQGDVLANLDARLLYLHVVRAATYRDYHRRGKKREREGGGSVHASINPDNDVKRA